MKLFYGNINKFYISKCVFHYFPLTSTYPLFALSGLNSYYKHGLLGFHFNDLVRFYGTGTSGKRGHEWLVLVCFLFFKPTYLDSDPMNSALSRVTDFSSFAGELGHLSLN